MAVDSKAAQTQLNYGILVKRIGMLDRRIYCAQSVSRFHLCAKHLSFRITLQVALASTVHQLIPLGYQLDGATPSARHDLQHKNVLSTAVTPGSCPYRSGANKSLASHVRCSISFTVVFSRLLPQTLHQELVLPVPHSYNVETSMNVCSGILTLPIPQQHQPATESHAQ